MTEKKALELAEARYPGFKEKGGFVMQQCDSYKAEGKLDPVNPSFDGLIEIHRMKARSLGRRAVLYGRRTYEHKKQGIPGREGASGWVDVRQHVPLVEADFVDVYYERRVWVAVCRELGVDGVEIGAR